MSVFTSVIPKAPSRQICFANRLPGNAWQRGRNENTNVLLRQYFPNGTDLSVYSQYDLDQVGLRLNIRPRKTLGFLTPADSFYRAVALTG
jgi:IS30 family transposase